MVFTKWLFLLLLSGLSFYTSACGAQSPQEEEQIGPNNLPPVWWDWIAVEEEEKRNQRIDILIKKSEEAVQSLSEEAQEQGKNLAEEIKQNLKGYASTVVQPLPAAPSATPFSEQYTIKQIVELNTNLQKLNIDLQSKTDEREQVTKQINHLQASLDTARQKHLDAPDRSEEKILFALEKIALRPAMELAKLKLTLLNRLIENDKLAIKYLHEEIALAKTQLVSTPQQFQKQFLQVSQKKGEWKESEKALQDIKDEAAKKKPDDTTEEGKIKSEIHTLTLTEASLSALATRNRYIEAEVIYYLELLLTQPDEVDFDALNQSLLEWKIELEDFRENLKGWFSQTERIVQRSAELLSIAEQEGKAPQSDLQKNVELGQKNLLTIQRLRKEIDETAFLLDVLHGKAQMFEGQWTQWFRKIIVFFLGLFGAIHSIFGKTLFYVRENPVTILGVIQFFLILFASWWVSKLLSRGINKFVRTRKGIRKSVIYRLTRLLHYVILVIGTLIALTVIGFDFSNLLIIAGALGVGLGFGLQSIFNNFLSGIIILFQSHLKVGDYVELDDGTRGEIREINVRSTIITTNDGLEVLVPNSEMLSNRIINWTLRDPYRRIRVPFSVAYGSDIDEVSRVVIAAAQKVPCTLQKIGAQEPQVFFMKFGDSSLEMELVVWVNEKWTRRINKTRSHYLWAIEHALKKNGIVVPFPQRDVHIIKP